MIILQQYLEVCADVREKFDEQKYENYHCGALIGGAASWYFKAEEQSGSYLTQKLEKGVITEKITASGTINPISTINIPARRFSGTISEIYVDYNSKVKKDQLLAQIDPALFEATVGQRRAALNVSKAEVQVAENEVDYAKKNLARIKKLNASRYSADKELDLAEKDITIRLLSWL